MQEMLKKILETKGRQALGSARAFEEAAADLGYAPEHIKAAVRQFDGFPLDDDDLGDIVGGVCGGFGGPPIPDYANNTIGPGYGNSNPEYGGMVNSSFANSFLINITIK